MTTSDEQLSGWIKKKLQSTSQSQTRTIKRSWSLVVWFPSDPLWLSESSETITSEKYAQQIGKMHQKLQCLQLTQINRQNPILLHENAWLQVAKQTLQKLNKLGYKVLPHLPYSLDFLPINYHFFKHLHEFLWGKCFHKQQEAENAFQEFVKSQNMDFYATGIKKLDYGWQKRVDCHGSYFG